MAENTINDFNTLPEQVQINKDDITKLKDDISKIKPNAWEERKFNIDVGKENGGLTEFTTYNPITDTNAPVNIQKSFTDKDTYSMDDSNNSYSYAVSGSVANIKLFCYVVCGDPSLSFNYSAFDSITATSYQGIVFKYIDSSALDGGSKLSELDINCENLTTHDFRIGETTINFILNHDDNSSSSLLTAHAVDQYYLKKTDASNTYVTKQDYEERIDTGDIQITTKGWTKFKAITDTEGQTIELNVPADLLEHVQVTGINDLKLQLIYNGHAVFENIYLHPNNTINNLDYITGAKTTYYTGQAMLTLSSQSNGLFYIVYQEGVGLTLHLITTI